MNMNDKLALMKDNKRAMIEYTWTLIENTAKSLYTLIASDKFLVSQAPVMFKIHTHNSTYEQPKYYKTPFMIGSEYNHITNYSNIFLPSDNNNYIADCLCPEVFLRSVNYTVGCKEIKISRFRKTFEPLYARVPTCYFLASIDPGDIGGSSFSYLSVNEYPAGKWHIDILLRRGNRWGYADRVYSSIAEEKALAVENRGIFSFDNEGNGTLTKVLTRLENMFPLVNEFYDSLEKRFGVSENITQTMQKRKDMHIKTLETHLEAMKGQSIPDVHSVKMEPAQIVVLAPYQNWMKKTLLPVDYLCSKEAVATRAAEVVCATIETLDLKNAEALEYLSKYRNEVSNAANQNRLPVDIATGILCSIDSYMRDSQTGRRLVGSEYALKRDLNNKSSVLTSASSVEDLPELPHVEKVQAKKKKRQLAFE